jgi:Phage tail assembly chaperone protein, TAC
MTELISVQASRLCGQTALALGWRPGEFWAATPAELACILAVMTPPEASPPPENTITQLMEMFPDG